MSKLIKVIFLNIIILVSAFLFTGCEVLKLNDDLLSPPSLTAKQEDIKNAIYNYAGSDISLIYPAMGENISSIFVTDINSDLVQEAIAFYSVSSESGIIHFALLDQQKEDERVWRVRFEKAIEASEIDRVDLVDFNGDFISELFIGTGTYIKEKLAHIYTFNLENGECNEIFASSQEDISYNQVLFEDINGDQKKNFIVVNSNEDVKGYSLNENLSSMDLIGTAKLDSDVINYSKISFERLEPNGKMALFLDSNTSGTAMISEIVYWDNKTNSLKAPCYNENTNSVEVTKRYTNVVCQDINNDFVTEVPFAIKSASINNLQQNNYYTVWQNYNSEQNKFFTVATTVVGNSNNFYIKVPNDFIVNVAFEFNEEQNTITFYKVQDGSKILECRVFSIENWLETDKNEYDLVTEENQLVYTYKKFGKEDFTFSNHFFNN